MSNQQIRIGKRGCSIIIDLVSELLLAAGGFVSTNLENVVILVSVFCANPQNARAVRLGFASGSLENLIGWVHHRFTIHNGCCSLGARKIYHISNTFKLD